MVEGCCGSVGDDMMAMVQSLLNEHFIRLYVLASVRDWRCRHGSVGRRVSG